GAARATAAEAMEPPAPARVSLITGWPHISDNLAVTMRLTMSTALPGVKATMTVTALLGYCACACRVHAASNRRTANLFMDSLLGLLWLDARGAKHLAGVFDFAAHELGEFANRHAPRLGAEIGEALAQVGALQRAIQVAIDLLRDLRRHVGRAPQPEPERVVEARNAGLGDGRHLGQQARAL